MSSTPRRERSAREWLVLVAIGLGLLVLGVFFNEALYLWAGVAFGLVGAVGLAWRLLKDR